MIVTENLRARLKTIANANISDDTYRKLLENTFSTLIKHQEVHSINTLCNSKPDIIKDAYAALLTIAAEFGRSDLNKEGIKTFLVNDCNYNSNRASLFADLYEKNRLELQVVLGNIGSHLPHVIDAKWKIDYIIKSSNVDQVEGPLFRISLVSSAHDETSGTQKTENINFSCNSQELQDLVYKLKDAVRHCQRLSTDQ